MAAPFWSVTRAPGSQCVVLVYKGYITDNLGELASLKALDLMDVEPAHLIADFMEMEGYRSHVREDWQRNVFPRRDQLLSVAVATQNVFIRMGVSAFGMMMSKPVTTFTSRADLMEHVARLDGKR